jgi:Mg2+ and Co2+ transporter CorA
LNEGLHTERTDLCELRDSCNNLINRTIQLVNIRLEDHGKAIMVFTIVTIVFLPLSFIASYFGMNTSDIRNLQSTQRLFWAVAGGLTAGVATVSIFLAFYGSWIVETFFTWRANRQEMAIHSAEKLKSF